MSHAVKYLSGIVASLCLLVAISEAATPVFPVKYGANSRYLVDQNNVPFPVLGRTAWFITSLSVSNYHAFIDDTAARGCTAIEFHVINHDPRGNNPPFNGNGDLPFLNRLDGAAWDGELTYSDIANEAPDLTTPHEAYWSLVDGLLAYCESKGILVFLFPAYTGYTGGDQGWMQELVANGPTAVQAYGAWIATRYKNQKNLVWMMGGDMGTAPYVFDPTQTSVEDALLTGLKSVSGQQSLLFGAQWASESISTDQTSFGSLMTVNGAYSWTGDVNSQGRRAYARTPVQPAFLLEEPFDEEGADGNSYNPSATQPVRRFQWWGWLSTIGGYVAGNGYVWPFLTNSTAVDWRNHLNTDGSQDMARLNTFIGSIAWHKLVPSGLDGMRPLLTDGGSSVNLADYVAAAAAPDGALLVAYIPPAHTGPITVDMGTMAGLTRARWFDPASAAYTDIATGLTNAGALVFTTPGSNGAGQADWVLLLEAAVADSAPPTVPPELAAKAVSPTQISLSWSSSSDNIQVAGYWLERAAGESGDNFAQIAVVGGTNYSDASLAANSLFRYRVRAADASTNLSAYSDVVLARTWALPVPWSGLVLDYAFDDGEGATAADASGNGNTGWLGGAAWTAQGKFGGGLTFDGSAYLTASNSTSLDLTAAVSLEAWVCLAVATNGWATIVTKETSTGFAYMLEVDGEDHPAVFVTTDASNLQRLTGPLSLPPNIWTHLAGTYDGASLCLFVNGVLAASNAVSGKLVSSASPLRVGGNALAGEWFKGSIDGVRIYDRALNATEVAAYRNRAAGELPAMQLNAAPQPTPLSATNGFRMLLSADMPATYVIEATTNLTTWETIAAVQYTNDVVPIVDFGGALPALGFYRALATNGAPNISLAAPAQSAAELTAAGFKLLITADAPAKLVVERSADLINWQPVGAVDHAGGTVEFTDPLVKLPPLRFYRARWQ